MNGKEEQEMKNQEETRKQAVELFKKMNQEERNQILSIMREMVAKNNQTVEK